MAQQPLFTVYGWKATASFRHAPPVKMRLERSAERDKREIKIIFPLNMRRATRSAFKIVYPKTDTRRTNGTFEDRQYQPAPPGGVRPYGGLYGDHKTVSMLKAEPNGAPYGVQIFGEVPEIMGEATAAMEQYEFDFVDINMGCPAPKIVSGGAGSKLMLDPDRCGRIVEQVVANTKRPVTVKMRKGWDADHITAVECAKACEQAGAALIAVHARTREQMYTPGIDPEIIARVKDAVRVPVLGNGDIHTAEDAVEMMQRTGCDGVMIARAALGDPWLFERVNAAIEGLPAPKAPNLQARMNALRRQVEEMVEQKGEFVAMPQARSQTMHYMKGLKGAAALRRYCCTLTHLEDLDELIDAVFEEQRKAGLDPDDVREVPFP